MSNIEVVGMGAMNTDHLYLVEQILLDGEAAVAEYQQSPGGSAANTIYALAKLGLRTGFIGAIGNDQAGRTLLRDFISIGVDISRIKTKKRANTGAVLCLSDSQGKRSLYVSPGANNKLFWQDIQLEYINQAKFLHLSSFVHKTQFKLQKKLVAGLHPSVKVSFAPGMLYTVKGLRQLVPLLKKTHVLFVNQVELRQLTGKGVRQGAEKCLEQGCSIVVVTSGKGRIRLAAGGRSKAAVCYILDRQGEYMVEPIREKAHVVDTTGAGDAFAAGFIYGMLKGKDLLQCGRLGDLIARCSIARIGAREGLPSLAELSKTYHQCYSGAPPL